MLGFYEWGAFVNRTWADAIDNVSKSNSFSLSSQWVLNLLYLMHFLSLHFVYYGGIWSIRSGSKSLFSYFTHSFILFHSLFSFCLFFRYKLVFHSIPCFQNTSHLILCFGNPLLCLFPGVYVYKETVSFALISPKSLRY